MNAQHSAENDAPDLYPCETCGVLVGTSDAAIAAHLADVDRWPDWAHTRVIPPG